MLPATVHQTAIENTLNGLMQEIAHCPGVEACFADRGQAHPCRAIVESQGSALLQFQVPEPWGGHLSAAPLLFVGSNPSICPPSLDDGLNEASAFPRWGTSAQTTQFYFEQRFEHFIVGGTKARHLSASLADRVARTDPDASISIAEAQADRKGVRFLQSVRRRAIELFGRDVQAGRDYALTEVVHCKSRGEYGVPEALAICAERYLARVIAASAARIIVLLGVPARVAFQNVLHVKVPDTVIHDGSTGWEYRHPWGPAELLGRESYVITLPHPNARGVPKSIEAYYGPDQLSDLRRELIGAGSLA